MKNSFFLLTWICIFSTALSAQLTNNGATIVVTPGTNLVLDNLSLKNNGVFTQTTSAVTFTGSANTFIGGTNALALERGVLRILPLKLRHSTCPLAL